MVVSGYSLMGDVDKDLQANIYYSALYTKVIFKHIIYAARQGKLSSCQLSLDKNISGFEGLYLMPDHKKCFILEYYLTLKQFLNLLLTKYRAIGLMQEFKEAMLMPM